MSSLKFEGHSGYGDTGIEEFSFIYNKDRYKILPKFGVPGSKDKIQGFMNFVKHIAPKTPDKNPWQYRVNAEQNFSKVFDIYKNGEKLESKKSPEESPPDAEQLNLFTPTKNYTFTASVDPLKVVLSYQTDKWLTNKATLFFDEIANQNIDPTIATKVLDIADKKLI